MTLIEEYYELNEAEEISAIWKVLQILCYGCAGGLGVWCGFTLSILRLTFNDRCYLFTEVKTLQKDVILDYRNINWEGDTCCDYFQFSMVSSFIVAIIWGALFLMCGKGGKSLTGLPQPWRIVWPSLVFNLIYFIVVFSNAIYIQRGTDKFCGHHSSYRKNYSNSFLDNCKVLHVLLKTDLQLTAFQIEVVAKTSWSSAFFWFILFLLPLFRIIFAIDFRLYKISVFKIDDTIQNKKEEVLKITNYEEPKKLPSDKIEHGLNVDFEKKSLNLEVRGKKKIKADKTRQNFESAKLTPLVTQTVFYETADIRMLNREKKMRKPPKSLDEGFVKIIPGFGTGLGNSYKIQSNSEVSSYSEMTTYRYPRGFYSDEEEYNNGSSMSTNNTPAFNEEENESPGGSEILVCDFGSNRFLRVKKQI